MKSEFGELVPLKNSCFGQPGWLLPWLSQMCWCRRGTATTQRAARAAAATKGSSWSSALQMLMVGQMLY